MRKKEVFLFFFSRRVEARPEKKRRLEKKNIKTMLNLLWSIAKAAVKRLRQENPSFHGSVYRKGRCAELKKEERFRRRHRHPLRTHKKKKKTSGTLHSFPGAFVPSMLN